MRSRSNKLDTDAFHKQLTVSLQKTCYNLMTLQLVNSAYKIVSYLDCNEMLLCHYTSHLICSINVWMRNCMNGACLVISSRHNISGYHSKWCRTEFLGTDPKFITNIMGQLHSLHPNTIPMHISSNPN